MSKQVCETTIIDTGFSVENWEFSDAIHRNAWGSVFYARKKGSNKVQVCKVCRDALNPNYDIDADEIDFYVKYCLAVLGAWQKEVKILSECSKSSEFIVDFLLAARVGSHALMLTEWCPLGTMKHLMLEKQIRGRDLLAIVFCVLKGLFHINTRGYYHGDIKPSNLLLSDKGVVQICDFGTADLAKEADTMRPLIKFGYYTRNFRAPEVLGEEETVKPGDIVHENIVVGSDEYATAMMKRDVWSLAITMYLLYVGPLSPRPDCIHESEEDAFRIFSEAYTEDIHLRPGVADLLEDPAMKEMEMNHNYSSVLSRFIQSRNLRSVDIREAMMNTNFSDKYKL